MNDITSINESIQLLIESLKEGDQHQAILEAQKMMQNGVESSRIVTECIEPAMTSLSDKCTVENFNLLEVMLACRAVISVMNELYPSEHKPPPVKATIILATLEGDVHDLGKNIVKMILEINGYNVIDCGKNCPLEQLIDTAEKEKALYVCLSGLITSIIPEVQRTKELLSHRNLQHIKIVAGGAALKQATAELLNVDFLAQTAFEGVTYISSQP
ncbi:MAG: cobalamin-binding protein [Gammaproteobacteria bacterium]|nr:cobalamin-binding protein [Gammaproteobacteria bacterium]